MKSIIIYASIHHKNTEKIAEAISDKLDARMVKFYKAEIEDILNHDLIGFGSGIYFGSFHSNIITLIKSFPKVKNKKVFIFSTSGVSSLPFLKSRRENVKKILSEKGFEIIGDFNCLGFDTYSFLKLIGGKNKGRPNKEDIKKAELFADELKKRINYD